MVTVAAPPSTLALRSDDGPCSVAASPPSGVPDHWWWIKLGSIRTWLPVQHGGVWYQLSTHLGSVSLKLPVSALGVLNGQPAMVAGARLGLWK